jgi:hypothetical protein
MVVEKRLNTEDVEISSESTKALKKEEGSSVSKPETNCDDVEMGEFEDPYGDELESDEEMVNAENEDMQMEDIEEQEIKKEHDNTIVSYLLSFMALNYSGVFTWTRIAGRRSSGI